MCPILARHIQHIGVQPQKLKPPINGEQTSKRKSINLSADQQTLHAYTRKIFYVCIVNTFYPTIICNCWTVLMFGHEMVPFPQLCVQLCALCFALPLFICRTLAHKSVKLLLFLASPSSFFSNATRTRLVVSRTSNNFHFVLHLLMASQRQMQSTCGVLNKSKSKNKIAYVFIDPMVSAQYWSFVHTK